MGYANLAVRKPVSSGRVVACRKGRNAITGLVVGLVVGLAGGGAAPGARPQGLSVSWGAGFTSVRFSYLGQPHQYPRDLREGSFGPVGDPPRFEVSKQWPVVAVRARWATPRDHWPEKYRDRILPLMLVRACDAELYPRLYPEAILTARFLAQPPWLSAAVDPLGDDLPRALRGQVVRYQIKADAGFGASDYVIRTQIRMGLSKDAKAIFYFDSPSYISDHLASREFLFAACDTGREIRFEVVAYCVCTPRYLFRGEAMRRVEGDCRYLIRRMYEEFDGDFGPQQIERYIESIEQKRPKRCGTSRVKGTADPPASQPATQPGPGG